MKASRSRLISLLSEASELEHGLACSYLFAAFSLKTRLSDGVSWKQQQKTKLWAAQIFAVAAEEMLHLAQAWNILAAVGGAPYYLRPNFPQGRKYYGFGQPLALEPFGLKSLDRFIGYETPAELLPLRPADFAENDPANYRSVGELYALIEDQLAALPEDELFFEGKQGEMGPAEVHFPALVPVRDAESALKAIKLITDQGEGIPANRKDCHYGTFLDIRADLIAMLEADPAFAPARRVVENPVARIRADWAGHGKVRPITDPYARDVCDLFDDIYTLMLRLLQHAFASGPTGPAAVLFAGAAIDSMVTVLKPLGEALTMLPAGGGEDLRAGASFGLTRHAPLPAAPDIAIAVAAERCLELGDEATQLASVSGAPDPLQKAATNIVRIAAIILARRQHASAALNPFQLHGFR